jgi:hypothetical protein
VECRRRSVISGRIGMRWLVVAAAVVLITVGCDRNSRDISGMFTSFRDLPNGDQEVCVVAGGEMACRTGFISIVQGPLEGKCVMVLAASTSKFIRVVRSDDACKDETAP